MIDNKWIDKKIYWLTAIFGTDDNFFINNFNATPYIYSFFETGKTDDIIKVVNFISDKLGFVPPNVQYDWSGEVDESEKIRGIMSQGRIVLSLLNTTNKYALAATTIHELMHYVLINRKGINLPDKTENEKITDLAAIVLGFGNLIFNGKVLKINSNAYEGLGILTIEETAYAYYKVCSLRKIYSTNFLTADVVEWLSKKGGKKQGGKNQSTFEAGYTTVGVGKQHWNIRQKFLKIIYSLPYKIKDTKNILFIKIKQLIKDIILKRKRKNCPFCKRKIQINFNSCPHCKRQIVTTLKD